MVFSPSGFMLDWVRQHGWVLPALEADDGKDRGLRGAAVFHNPLPTWIHRSTRIVKQKVEILELVFFGRLEVKRGLSLFCDALDRLSKEADGLKRFSVTFFGQEADEAEFLLSGTKQKVFAREYIKERGKAQGAQPASGRQLCRERRLRARGGERGGPRRQLAPALQWIHGGP